MTKMHEKLFVVEIKLAALNAIQSKMATNQNKSWVIIQEQFTIAEQMLHILGDCDQLLFAKQQLNFNFDAIYFVQFFQSFILAGKVIVLLCAFSA